MPTPTPFARLAATQPIVPLAVGYGIVCALLGVIVSVQSGVAAGVASSFANVFVLAPALGITWVLGRMVDRRAPEGQAWWMTRVQGLLVGFIATVTVAVVPLVYVAGELRKDPAAAEASWNEIALVLVATLAAVNGLPLAVAFGVEAWARRKAPPPKVTRPRGP